MRKNRGRKAVVNVGWKEVTSRWAAGGAGCEEEGRDKVDVDSGLLLLTNL